MYNPCKEKLDNLCTVIPKNIKIHSIVNLIKVNNDMQKEKKLKQNKLWFLALLTHSSACNEINFKEAKGKYLNSRKHDDSDHHYQLTNIVQYNVYHQYC